MPTFSHIRRFACIGDVHGRLDRLQSVVSHITKDQIVAVLMTGDFGSTPSTIERKVLIAPMFDRALQIVRTLGLPILFVPGNHDDPMIDDPSNVEGKMITVQSIRISGIGGSGPHRFGFPYEWSESDIRARKIPDWDILISHTPPAQTKLDRLADCGVHAGSMAIRELTESKTGVLLSGHIHEAVGAQMLGSCLCYNVGSLGDPFGATQYGIISLDVHTKRASIQHMDLDKGHVWYESA